MFVHNPTGERVSIRHVNHSRLVLLLEKHPTISEMLVTALRFAGQTTICLDDGAALIRLIQTMPAVSTASFMVLDMSQPQTSVEAVVEPLLAQWQRRGMTPPGVIVLTTQPHMQQAAFMAGYPALLKPFHLHDFFVALRTCYPTRWNVGMHSN